MNVLIFNGVGLFVAGATVATALVVADAEKNENGVLLTGSLLYAGVIVTGVGVVVATSQLGMKLVKND